MLDFIEELIDIFITAFQAAVFVVALVAGFAVGCAAIGAVIYALWWLV